MQDVFYEQLLNVLTAALALKPAIRPSERRLLSIHLVLELLTYCAKVHGYLMRLSVVHNHVLDCVLPLLLHPAKSLRLDALRFFRALLVCKDDDLLLPFIVAHDFFSPIFALLKSTPRKNLLYSALLELFDYIVKANLKSLILYLGQQHTADLKAAVSGSMNPFQTLLLRYDQYICAREATQHSLEQLPG